MWHYATIYNMERRWGHLYGVLLKRIRKERKLTQKQFAKLVGVDVTQISKWESGKFEPSKPNLNKIKKEFGKDIFLNYIATECSENGK